MKNETSQNQKEINVNEANTALESAGQTKRAVYLCEQCHAKEGEIPTLWHLAPGHHPKCECGQPSLCVALKTYYVQ